VDTGVPQGSPAAPILFITYLSGIFDAVKKAVLGISGLSFINDIGWWAQGKNDEALVANLVEAAAATIEWVEANGVAFDHSKIEVAIFCRKWKSAKAMVKVGGKEVAFNKEARWLRVWLDSCLKLRTYYEVRMK